ncbi:hypothetical protein FOL47_006247, partial [Perkinsus chesapeaki]
ASYPLTPLTGVRDATDDVSQVSSCTAGMERESLECSLGRQIRSFRGSAMCDMVASAIAYFVDDLLAHFSSTDAAKATFVLSLLLCFLSLCGFAISIAKFAVLVHQSALHHVTALREYAKVSMLVLGILLSYDSEGLV